MNAKPYPKYKPSGVEWLGKVPEHWEVKRGRFSVRVNPPSEILRKLPAETEVSFVPMEAVGVDGGLKLDQEKPISEVGAGYTEFQEQDIVVAKITPCFENGKAAIAEGLTNQAAYGTTELHVLRSRKDMDHRFLFYVILSDTFRKLGEAEMYGAGGQKRVPPEFCKDFRISIPPRPEQEAIADFLDDRTAKLDALLEKKRALIGKLKEKRSALISRTVTQGLPPEAAAKAGLNPKPKFNPSGIPWLGDIPEHWEVWKHSHLFNSSMGQTILKEETSDSGLLPVLSATETYAVFGYLDTAAVILNEGDFVIPARGNSIGHVKLVRERCTTTQTTIYSKKLSQKIHSEYAYYYLMGNRDTLFHFDRTAIPQLTVGQVQSNPFLLPPLSEQVAIATYLDRESEKIDRMILKVETAIEKLAEYRTALITAAVTGKIKIN